MKEKLITYVLTMMFLMSGTIATISMVNGQAQTATHQSEMIFYLPSNSPPNKPQKPVGPNTGKPGESKTYTTVTTDPDNDQVYYNWSWGDGTYSDWDGPWVSGESESGSHTWTETGTYEVKVKAKDTHGAESDWSDSLIITMKKSYDSQSSSQQSASSYSIESSQQQSSSQQTQNSQGSHSNPSNN